jgi:exoribonuclease R
MQTSKAHVLFRNHKYFYRFENETDERELVRSPLTPNIIPGDIIQVENHKPVLIIERVQQHTIAIIRGISNGQVYLYCPLMSPFFNPAIPNTEFEKEHMELGMRLLVYITKDNVVMKKAYSNVMDRTQDRQIIEDLYNSSEFVLPTLLYNTEPAAEPLYTKPFVDQTDLPTFTVDPHQSRDFDDAISIVGNTVYVHIVDIHSQMPMSSIIDKEAARLGFTLYTPEGNHNIVPTEKAEHEWSLIANEKRQVITIEIRYNDMFGFVESYDIYPSLIVVKHRYTYDNAPSCHLAKVITERVQRFNYTIPQLQLSINPSTGQVYEVKHALNTDMNHRMIETFMVTANMIVSDHLRTRSPSYSKIPQRFHKKLHGISTHPPTGDPIVDSFLAIKKYAYAVYDPEKCGHYGLNLQSYTHFTSPIRRYFDVIIHRMLAGVEYTESELQTILDHINRRELGIAALTKLYQQWKLLATINVGDDFDVIVTRISAAGVNYLYKPFMMDGFIHVSALGGAQQRQQWHLRNGSDGVAELYTAPDQVLRIGTCLKCKVVEVDLIKQLVTVNKA